MSATLQDVRPAPLPRRRFAFLLKPGWLGAIVGALAFTAACWLVLAPWQFGRNAETSATNSGIDAAMHATPVPVRRYLSVAGEPDRKSIWKPVTATGVFVPDRQFYVRLRQDEAGNPVSEVVLPMRLTDGTVLLVDRGTRSTLDIGNGLALPPVPTGVVTVTGRVQQDQTDPRHRKPGLLQGLDQAYAVNANDLAGSAAAGGGVLQGYIQLMDGSPGVLAEIGMPQTDSGPYLSYALQWCAFGAMSLLAIGYFIFREVTDPRGPDDRDVAYPSRAAYPQRGDPTPTPTQTQTQTPTGPSPVAAAATATATNRPTSTVANRATKTKRRGHDGFDRSELYD